MNMQGIYKFYWDCGRSGCVESLFIADTKEVVAIQGKEIYFGEILGKHSEIYGTIDPGDIKLLTDDQAFIEKFKEIMGYDLTISGHNPLSYYEPEDDVPVTDGGE
jgi:hypothetical protein